ncbi:MAG TPA: tetratricopeptide repeat protein [Silvibacterium sp.]|nr:tetratricopeptide repeat protein [Silvibacterium sp.]
MFTGSLWSQQSTNQLQALFREGAAQMHAGNTAAAEAAFRKATELDPSFAPAQLDLGLAQLKEGKLLEAIASIRKSLELDPASPGAHLFLGIAEYQSSDTDAALQDLHLALQEDPKNVQALTWLGIVELNAGHPELASGPLDRAAELAPRDENVLDYRVQAHMAEAKQSYTALYQLDPGSWRLHRLNAVIDSQANDHNGAVAEYQLAIKLAPNDAELYEGMGWEYRKLGQADQAAKAFAEQLKLSPGNPIAMYNLGSAEVDSGRAQEAVPLLEEVVKIYNHPTGADYYLGRALASEGKEEEAVLAFQRATTLDGELQRRAWYQLSQTYRHLGKTAQAREAALKYEQLKKAADDATTKEAEDWQKLRAAGTADPGNSGQQ